MPATNHVSSIVSSDIGMSDKPKFTVSPFSLFMWMPHAPHCACRHPDAHIHLPVTRHPPSTGFASPCGASDPAIHASRLLPQMSCWARSGKRLASHAHTLMRLATHDVEPHPRPSASIT